MGAADTLLADTAAPDWFRWAMSQPGQSRRVTVDGASLNLWTWGEQHTEKPALLLVHGFRGHARWWDHIAPFLAQTHRVFALDLSGMGDSDHRASYDRNSGAADISGALDALQLGPVIGIGHSNGGMRVLGACARRPELFERLIVIDSYLVFNDAEHPKDPPRLKADRVHPDKASIVARHRLLPEQTGNVACVLDHIAQHAVRETEGGWRWKFDSAMVAGPSFEDPAEELLPRVARPTHVVFGEESLIVKPALAERTVRHLPQGHGPIGIPGGHHHLMIDQPVALIATLRALLA